MVHPALDALRRLIDRADSDSVKITAIKDVLDRTGFKPPVHVEAEQDTTIHVVYETVPVSHHSARTNGAARV